MHNIQRFSIASALLAIIAITSVGCRTRVMDCTLASTKNINLARGAEFQRMDKRVTGRDTKHIIIFVPTGTPSPKDAMDRAIEQVPGCVALADCTVHTDGWWIPYIYGQSSIEVTGTPVVDPVLRAELSPAVGPVYKAQ